MKKSYLAPESVPVWIGPHEVIDTSTTGSSESMDSFDIDDVNEFNGDFWY